MKIKKKLVNSCRTKLNVENRYYRYTCIYLYLVSKILIAVELYYYNVSTVLDLKTKNEYLVS